MSTRGESELSRISPRAYTDMLSAIYIRSRGAPGFGYVTHPDGDGSKPVQNYLNWILTGDIGCFRGMAQDALAMNIGDAFCVGVPQWCSFVDYVAVNPLIVPKKRILRILAQEFGKLSRMLKEYGIILKIDGGETADLPDQIRTLDVSGTIHAARYRLDRVITGDEIGAGDVIIGVESGGRASYEEVPSGALMCNGLTLARHCLMRRELGDEHPEILQPGKVYYGRFMPGDRPHELEGSSVGAELTRPARIFAPVQKRIIEQFGDTVHGLVYNTGGGATKCLRIGSEVRYVKDSMPEPPGIFRLIQREGKVRPREMFQDLNMGVGMDVIVDSGAANDIEDFVRTEFNLDAWRIGEVRRARGPNKLRIETPGGNFNYRRN